MTTKEFRARMAHAADSATESGEAPCGRSYHVHAPTRDLAPSAARLRAMQEGWRSHGRVLHVERIEPGLYEVVLAE